VEPAAGVEPATF